MAPRGPQYLYQRSGSQNWWLKLQTPAIIIARFGGSSMERRSLGTPDRKLAEALAAPDIAAHKMTIAFMRAADFDKGKFRKHSQPKQEVGAVVFHPDGTESRATPSEISYWADGVFVRSEPNIIVNSCIMGLTIPNADKAIVNKVIDDKRRKLKAPIRNIDKEILDHYFVMNSVQPRLQNDARNTLAVFKEICPTKNFASADFDDGRALCEGLYDRGCKSRTVKKRVGFLRAAVNVALRTPKKFPMIKTNPFSGVVVMRNDANKKVMFDDADMRAIRANFDQLEKDEKLLWILTCGTGMRRGEAFQILGEQEIDGYRTVDIGTKTVASNRQLPLPSCVLPYLPEKIEGSLFTGSEKNVGRNLNRWLRKIGITDPSKTLHSTRHRASYKLRALRNDSLRHRVLGHEDNTKPSEQYGGFPMEDVAKALETIGL